MSVSSRTTSPLSRFLLKSFFRVFAFNNPGSSKGSEFMGTISLPRTEDGKFSLTEMWVASQGSGPSLMFLLTSTSSLRLVFLFPFSLWFLCSHLSDCLCFFTIFFSAFSLLLCSLWYFESEVSSDVSSPLFDSATTFFRISPYTSTTLNPLVSTSCVWEMRSQSISTTSSFSAASFLSRFDFLLSSTVLASLGCRETTFKSIPRLVISSFTDCASNRDILDVLKKNNFSFKFNF